MLIRLLMIDELRDAGYDVVEAANADEALAVLSSLIRIDLIISDVRMPGSMDGLGLLAVVKADFPMVPVIIMSAHLQGADAIADGAAQFLSKPFSSTIMVQAIQQELATNI